MTRGGGIAGELARHPADWAALTLVLLAVALQFQLTLTVGSNPVRISAADAVSAPLAVVLVVRGLRQEWQWPRWRLPRLWLWLALLTATMTAALVLGRLYGGAWLSWALFNKYAGWFALLWYLLLGGWLASQCSRALERFILPFVICAAAICAYSALCFLLRAFWGVQTAGGFDAYRAVGFMANPNAFGMLLATAVALQLPLLATAAPSQDSRHGAALTLLMLGLVLSLSRSAWLGFAFALGVSALLRALALRPILIASAIALSISGALIYGVPATERGLQTPGSGPSGLFAWSMQKNIAERALEFEDYGSYSRLEAAGRAIEMWRERPLFGIGLGTFLRSQIEAGKSFPSIIHNTGLWLLTETGLVGALAFAGFFVACVRALARNLDRSGGEDWVLRVAALGVLAVFAGASVGTEAMYQRYLWFIVGMALAAPPAALPAARDRRPSGG